jgi:hypothetical protein
MGNTISSKRLTQCYLGKQFRHGESCADLPRGFIDITMCPEYYAVKYTTGLGTYMVICVESPTPEPQSSGRIIVYKVTNRCDPPSYHEVCGEKPHLVVEFEREELGFDLILKRATRMIVLDRAIEYSGDVTFNRHHGYVPHGHGALKQHKSKAVFVGVFDQGKFVEGVQFRYDTAKGAVTCLDTSGAHIDHEQIPEEYRGYLQMNEDLSM